MICTLFTYVSCSDFSKTQDHKNASKNKKVSTSKKVYELKSRDSSTEITGVLSSGVRFEVMKETDGYVIIFDPFIQKNDEIFTKATNQIIAKIYNDQVSDESHISIESDIDYTIFKGQKARYRIVPFKESSGEISSISISSII